MLTGKTSGSVAGLAGQQQKRDCRSRWAAPVLLCAGLALAACGDISRFQTPGPALSVTPAKPNRAVVQTPASEREHERILATYGGVYDDPKLEGLISKTVERLVAASDRPEQAYRVTILNSGAVNAFALPTGQLYVTRGLVALASDTSELSSVLSHEMAHVLAKHAASREDQAKQAAVWTRVTEMSSDPDLTALALAKTKLAVASFSRAQEFEADGIGVGISAKAQFDPYGAARFLSAMERNASLKAGKASLDPRAQDFLSSHPATPERVQHARTSAKQYNSPQAGERDRETYLSTIDNIVYGEDPSEGFVRGRRFLHPKLGFTFAAPDTFTLDNTAQAVIGVRDGGTQAAPTRLLHGSPRSSNLDSDRVLGGIDPLRAKHQAWGPLAFSPEARRKSVEFRGLRLWRIWVDRTIPTTIIRAADKFGNLVRIRRVCRSG